MKVGYVLRNAIAHTFTVGICEIIFVEGEKESHEDSTNEGFNPFSLSLTFGNPIRATRGILELVRDVSIVVGRRVSPLRSKG